MSVPPTVLASPVAYAVYLGLCLAKLGGVAYLRLTDSRRARQR